MVNGNIAIRDSVDQKEQKHKDLRIIYVIEGDLNVEYSGKQNSLISGSFCIINPGESYSIHCKKDTLYCEIEIEYRWLCNITGRKTTVFKYNARKEDNLTEIALLNQLIEWHVCQNEKSDLYGCSILYKLLDIFIKKYAAGDYKWTDQKNNRTHAIKEAENSIVSEEIVKAQADNRKKSSKKIKCLLNVGSAASMLQSDMQQHIIWMKRKVGIDYLRFWAPFSRQMVYVQDGEYVFNKLDKVLDFLVEQQICPFIDLGNKPRRIQKSAMESVLFEEGDIIEGLDEWEKLLKQWAFHLKERYGREAGRWYFELWRNENSSGRMDEFLKGFDVAYQCIKAEIPDAQVGGYGIIVSDYDILLNDLKDWMSHRFTPDFISAYFYAYEIQGENIDRIVRRSSDKLFLGKLYNRMKKIQAEAGMEKIPIYATEWNISISDRNVINDTCARAAYYLHNQIGWAEEDVVLGYFYASDCLSEFTDSKALMFGGAGLITRNGIFKPAAYAVQFINKSLQYIVKRGEHYLITADNDDNYAIVCENYKEFNYLYYLKEEDEIVERESLFFDLEMLSLQFEIEKIRNGIYEIRQFSVNASHGSVYDEWKRLGFLNQIGYEDIEYLRHVCVPQIHAERKSVDSEVLKLHVQLVPNEINYVQIKFLRQEL